MAVEIHSAHDLAVDIDDRRSHALEHALFHPNRGSVVSVSAQCLQEIDPQHGSTMGEAVFDLAFLGDKPAAAAAARLLEHVVPVGAHHVAAVFQSRCLVVWDLRDAVLQSVTEVEKQQKSVAALAGSLCKDKWLFYASEGSNSIKVSAVDAREPPKKISRKAANRSSQLTALAYHSARRVLGAGASDGALQLWTFSEENTVGGGGGGAKDEAALATPLFATQTTQAPVVQLTFAACGLHAHLLVVAYQNRVVEVWDLATSGTAAAMRPRDPHRVAVLHCLPPQAMDFAKKNGELAFVFHVHAPLLLVHWHAYGGAGSCAAAVELRLGVGSAGSPPAPVTLSDWHEFVPAAPPSHEDGSAVLLLSTNAALPASPFMAYTSHPHRQLLPLTVTSPKVSAAAEETNKLALSTGFQLSLEQYFKYQDVPSTLLQVSRNADAPAGQALALQLQRYAQTTGDVEKLDDLPVWNNYQGRQLLPWRLRWNEQQSAVCVQLQDPAKSIASEADGGFSYVALEIKAKTRLNADADGDGGGVSVTCGSPLDALDVCFCDSRGDESTPARPFVMAVLATTGRSISFQMNCDRVDQDARVALQQPVQRVFATPLGLSPSSQYASLVARRLMYVVVASDVSGGGGDGAAASGAQTLFLSGDDLSVPRCTALGFTTRPDSGERILDVLWNASSSSSSSDTYTQLLAAVWTTQRVVVLTTSAASASLSVVAEYDLEQDLGAPQSLLWVAQTLLFVTSGQLLRFATPLRKTDSPTTTHLLCSLAVAGDSSAPQKVQLISLCSDRLCYVVTDMCSLECRTYMRPVAVCEPLLLGFAEASDARLRAILERDVLVFLLSGGQETRNPVSEKLLDVLFHDFGWTEPVAKVLDAMANPSSLAAAVSAGGAGGTQGSGGSTYKKTAHLPAASVASLMLHAHKWRDAVRVFLAHDPALEEYALADDDGLGASSAKLPSRTGRLAQSFRRLAVALAGVGQAELAVKCLDLAGDDLGIVELLKTHGLDAAAAAPVLLALQKDWATLNPPLCASTKAATPPDSAVHRRHDLFSLLCCEQLTQIERRSRLLTTVRPFDKLTVAAQKPESSKGEVVGGGAGGRAAVSYWKRLSPEDAKDAIGSTATPHFSSEEPKNPSSYAIFSGSTVSGSGLALGGAAGSGGGVDAASALDGGASASSESAAKMTIGPFLEDEDAVVAYWRFEEGATANDDPVARTLESQDTTKRENHLQVLQFASRMALVASTAPVDKGEDAKLQEEFALRFPAASTLAVSAGSSAMDEWGAKCAVRAGSTLDIGLVFDEDPYRRRLTVEAWVRNFELFRKQQKARENDGDGDGETDGFGSEPAGGSSIMDDAASPRRLVARRGVDKATWWEFGLCDGGCLSLSFGGATLTSEDRISNAASWQHVAFSVDIASPRQAVLKLFLQARCVATKEIANVDGVNSKLLDAAAKTLASMGNSSSGLPPPPSTLHLGLELTDYEMTEVRVWATARTPEQLSDMKENYLGLAEAKRRMKIAIHQRNCQCEKCLARRAHKPFQGVALGAKSALPTGLLFPSTPPSVSASARDRRRPQPKT